MNSTSGKLSVLVFECRRIKIQLVYNFSPPCWVAVKQRNKAIKNEKRKKKEPFVIWLTDIFAFLLVRPAPVIRSQPSTRSLTARTSLGQQRKTSSSFRCGYSFRFPGERVTYNRQVSTSSEGNVGHLLEFFIYLFVPHFQTKIAESYTVCGCT